MTSSARQQSRCLRCHRILRAQKSQAAGYGRYCAARIRAAALAKAVEDFTPAQIDKALEAIADGAVIATSRPGVYRSVSSDGSTVYLSHWAGCTCAAGLHDRLCYHRAAVRLLSAAKAAARKAA